MLKLRLTEDEDSVLAQHDRNDRNVCLAWSRDRKSDFDQDSEDRKSDLDSCV